MYLDDCVCVLPDLTWLPLLSVGRKSWYIIIYYIYICVLSPFIKVPSHHYADDTWTSNVCHGHNFHRRDLKFSDIPNTTTIFKHDEKKNYKNLITSGMVLVMTIYFHIYQFLWWVGGVHGSPYISLFIQKNIKITRAWPIPKSNSSSFWSNVFFFMMNKKRLWKIGAGVAPVKCFRKWVLLI